MEDKWKVDFKKKVAFLFGSEASGLTNDEITYTNYTLQNKRFLRSNKCIFAAHKSLIQFFLFGQSEKFHKVPALFLVFTRKDKTAYSIFPAFWWLM